jgi:hypothetical protein
VGSGGEARGAHAQVGRVADDGARARQGSAVRSGTVRSDHEGAQVVVHVGDPERVATILPGRGYGPDFPVLYYTRALLLARHWTVRELRWGALPADPARWPGQVRQEEVPGDPRASVAVLGELTDTIARFGGPGGGPSPVTPRARDRGWSRARWWAGGGSRVSGRAAPGVRAAGAAGRGPRGCRSRRGPSRGAGGCRSTR